MSAIQEAASSGRADDAVGGAAVALPPNLGLGSGAGGLEADLQGLVRQVLTEGKSVAERLALIDTLAPRIGLSDFLYLYRSVVRECFRAGGNSDSETYLRIHNACRVADDYDLFFEFIKRNLILNPERADIYFKILQLEVRLCRVAAAAGTLRRMMCIDPRVAARKLVIDSQAQIMGMGQRALNDQSRGRLGVAMARGVGGADSVETMARQILRAGSTQVEPRRIREVIDLARAIDRPDVARDVLQRHRDGPLAWAREYWDMVKVVQEAGSGLAEGFYPFSIHLESVNACNAACVMCPVSSTSRRRKRMAGDLVDKVIDEIKSFPFLPKVGLHGVGEPLLHKDLAARVARFAKAGIGTYFSTNGQLMTERKAAELMEAGLHSLIFSLETMDAAVFEATRIGLSFDVVLNNIKNFLKLRARLGADTVVQVTLVRAPEAEERILADIDMIRGMLSADDQLHVIPRHNFTGGYASGEAADSPCNHPFVQLNMTSDGLVTACCLDSEQAFVAGDFNSQSMLEIYNGRAFQELRRQHIEGRRREVDVCRDCTGPETWERQLWLRGTAMA